MRTFWGSSSAQRKILFLLLGFLSLNLEISAKQKSLKKHLKKNKTALRQTTITSEKENKPTPIKVQNLLEHVPALKESLSTKTRSMVGVTQESRTLKQLTVILEKGSEILMATVLASNSDHIDVHIEKKHDRAISKQVLESNTFQFNGVSFNTKQNTHKLDLISTPVITNLNNYSYCLRSTKVEFLSTREMSQLSILWNKLAGWRAVKTNDFAILAQSLKTNPDFQKLFDYLEVLLAKKSELLDALYLANSRVKDEDSCTHSQDIFKTIYKEYPDLLKGGEGYALSWSNNEWTTYDNVQSVLIPAPFLINWLLGNLSYLKENGDHAFEILDITDGFGQKGLKLGYSHSARGLEFFKAQPNLGFFNLIVSGYMLFGAGGKPLDVQTTRSKINIFLGGDEEVFSFRLY